MSDEPKDGGPAFSRPMTHHQQRFSSHHDNGCAGMSLRDYFAAAALQGLITTQGFVKVETPCKTTAGAAYEFADAMLAARRRS